MWKFKETCGNRPDFVRSVDPCCAIPIYDVHDSSQMRLTWFIEILSPHVYHIHSRKQLSIIVTPAASHTSGKFMRLASATLQSSWSLGSTWFLKFSTYESSETLSQWTFHSRLSNYWLGRLQRCVRSSSFQFFLLHQNTTTAWPPVDSRVGRIRRFMMREELAELN